MSIPRYDDAARRFAHDVRVLRITMINPATEERHVDAMLEAVRHYA